MGDTGNAVQVQLEVEQLKVEYRPVKRLGVADATQIALDLLGVVALMLAQALELCGDAMGQLGHGGLGRYLHLHR